MTKQMGEKTNKLRYIDLLQECKEYSECFENCKY